MRRRLRILGRPLDLDVTVPADRERPARDPVDALFDAARQISESVSEVVRGSERARGHVSSCKAGCAACCRQLVPISIVEAVHLARAVEALPRERMLAVKKRFADAVRRMEKAELLDATASPSRSAMTVAPVEGESTWDTASRRYRELAVACPLLEQQRCAIYEERPLVCREYAVTSPAENCSHPRSQGVEAMPRPIHMSEALADTVTLLAVNDDAARSLPMTGAIPLPLALEWVEHHGAGLVLEGHEATIAKTLLDVIEVEDG